MVTLSTRPARPVDDICFVRVFRGVVFLAMTVRFHVQFDRLPQTDDRANRVKNERYPRDAGENEGINDDSPAQHGGSTGRIVHVVYQDIGRPMRGDPFIEELSSQLINRADIVAR